MKAIRIITTNNHGKDTTIQDVYELAVTQKNMMTSSGYICKSLGNTIQEAIVSVDSGQATHIWIEVIK